jgi:hypothetical protein
MRQKTSKKKIDWLQDWDKTYYWSGLSQKQIDAEKQKIVDFVKSTLKASDSGRQITQPKFKGHSIKFTWFSAPGSQFIVSAFLTPSAKEVRPPNGGSGGSLLSPTPPPQP